MNSGSEYWQSDDLKDQLPDTELLDIGGGLSASAPGSRARVDRGPPLHESLRKSFANGPAAQEAAAILHKALRLPSPQAVTDDLDRRMTGLVDHRFDNRIRESAVRKRLRRLQY